MHGWGVRKSTEQSATDVFLMNEVDKVVIPSETSRRLLESLGVAPQLLTVVPYGIGPALEAEPDPDLELLRNWKARGFVVMVCIGTVGRRKNQRMIVQALASGEAPGNLACAFLGEGQDIPELEMLAENRGLGERLKFFGHRPAAHRFLNAADWLILASLNEGLPLSVLEAYRAGVPVLGSDIDEIAEAVLPGQTGLLFNARELDSLIAELHNITRISEESRRLMGETARRLWREKYSLEIMLTRYNAVYRELLESKPRLGQ
jgi:glycosyltransferase involved in cell wall biosynthesis